MCLVFFSGPASISHRVDYDSPSVRLVSDQYEAAAPLVEMIIAPRFQTLGCHTILFTIRYNVMLCHIMSHNVTQYFSWQYNVTLCHTTSHNTFQYTGHSTFLLIVMNYWTTRSITLDKIQHLIIDQVQSLETIISRCVQSLCCHTMWLCTERKSIKGIFDELWRIEIKWPLSKIILQHTLETPKEPHNIKN